MTPLLQLIPKINFTLNRLIPLILCRWIPRKKKELNNICFTGVTFRKTRKSNNVPNQLQTYQIELVITYSYDILSHLKLTDKMQTFYAKFWKLHIFPAPVILLEMSGPTKPLMKNRNDNSQTIQTPARFVSHKSKLTVPTEGELIGSHA